MFHKCAKKSECLFEVRFASFLLKFIKFFTHQGLELVILLGHNAGRCKFFGLLIFFGRVLIRVPFVRAGKNFPAMQEFVTFFDPLQGIFAITL